MDTALDCEWIPSPNFEPRKPGCQPDLLLIHYTATPTLQDAIDVLTSPAAPRVSCHYLVDENGNLKQLVSERDRAWHAGKSHWAGVDDINSCSIGIEIQNGGHDAGLENFSNEQMNTVEALCLDILNRHQIPPERVLGHSDVAPDRKADPGEKFDWKRLYMHGIGHWVAPEPITSEVGIHLGDEGDEVLKVQSLLKSYGYNLPVSGKFDEMTAHVVTAFQRHFRQEHITGCADTSTIETLKKLLAGLRK